MRWPWTQALETADLRQKEQTATVVDAVKEMLDRSRTAASSFLTSERREEELADLRARLATESQEIVQRLEAIESRTSDLATALAHGIEHEERRERRIRATVKRARRQLEELGVEDAGLEAEFDGLSVVDGGAVEEGELPSVRGTVAEDVEVAESSVAGVSRAQLQRARGFGP